MADIPRIPISDLSPASKVVSGDLLEVAEPKGTGYLSKRVTGQQIANYVNTSQQYADLNTADKTAVGAINEVLQIATGFVFMDTLIAGQTVVQFQDPVITENSTVELYTSIFGVMPNSVTTVNGSITIVFEAQSFNVGVKVVVRE